MRPRLRSERVAQCIANIVKKLPVEALDGEPVL